VNAIRAAVLRAPGEAAAIERLDLAEPRAGEVRVRILASGVCHSDLHVRDGDWPRPLPIAMGHEGAGVIEAVGPGVRSLAVGQPVALSWLVPCGSCRSCRSGRVWACVDSPSFRHRLPDGATVLAGPNGGDAVLSYCGIGTMAEATVVPEAAAIALPAGVDPAVAALIGCCVTTGVGAVLKTAEVPRGASVAVIGLGGVGLSCVMGAAIAGASRIVAIDRVTAKLDAARSVGATDGLVAGDRATTIEALRDLTDGGPDYVFEAIGRVDTVELAIDSLPLGGTAVLVGLTPFEARASFGVYPLVDGSRRILGSNYGFADPATDFPRYAAMHLAGRLPVERLIDRRVGLDGLEDAFDRLRAGDGLRGVVVFD
jgi:S-(hydroxymethyl)glutathione dehydrogenase/alcohol dehydrogenase